MQIHGFHLDERALRIDLYSRIARALSMLALLRRLGSSETLDSRFENNVGTATAV